MKKYTFIEENDVVQRSMHRNKLNKDGYEVNDPRPIKIHIAGDRPLKSIKHISDFSAFMMQKKLDKYMHGEQETEEDLYDFNPVNILDHEVSEKQEESMYQLAAELGAEVQELGDPEALALNSGVEGGLPPTAAADEESEDTDSPTVSPEDDEGATGA